jgi:hypothetical protein
MRSQGSGSSVPAYLPWAPPWATAEGGDRLHIDGWIEGKDQRVAERITRTTVTFRHPFGLAGVEGEQPAGTYAVETTEEPIGGLSFLAYRRVSTTIVLAAHQFGGAARQAVAIDPSDLDSALKQDATKADPS